MYYIIHHIDDWDRSSEIVTESMDTFSRLSNSMWQIIITGADLAAGNKQTIQGYGNLPKEKRVLSTTTQSYFTSTLLDISYYSNNTKLNIYNQTLGNFLSPSKNNTVSIASNMHTPSFEADGSGKLKDLIIIDKTNTEGAGWVLLPSNARTLGFMIRHPIASAGIGKVDPGKGKTDITNNSVRFSTNDLGLIENQAREGSQVNAFRHVLWQATITSEFGVKIAAEIGNAHEDNPYALYGINDFSKVRFTTLSLADETVDLLNNKIGREIGGKMEGSNMKDIALATLEYYHAIGLWVAEQQLDGNYAIFQQILSDQQYNTANIRLNLLDNNGFDPEQAKLWYK